MKKNVGSTDKIIRFVLAAALASLFFVLEGDMKWLGALAVIPLVTGLVSFCPIWAMVGVNTNKK